MPWRRLALIVALGGALYGACMGSYGSRPLQAVYSATKVPLLLGASTLVCLPNFYVVNNVLGLRDDFAAAMRAIIAAQATVAIALASLAPVIVFAYVATDGYRLAIVLNGVLFAGATIAGQSTLERHYAALVARNPRHRIGRLAWLTLYVFVAVQLAWMLRPFVGSPSLDTSFLREGALGNAYVEVFRTLLGAFTGK